MRRDIHRQQEDTAQSTTNGEPVHRDTGCKERRKLFERFGGRY